MSAPTLPKSVVLDLDKQKLFIDGAEFPWFIEESGVEIIGLAAGDRTAIVRFGMLVPEEVLTVVPAKAQVVG